MSSVGSIRDFSNHIYPNRVQPIIPAFNRVHEAIANNQVVFAAFLSNANLRMTDAIIHATEADNGEGGKILFGPAAAFIDYEHAPFTTREVEDLVIYLHAAGVVPFVRVRENNPDSFKPFLDMGALGLIIPQIGSKEDAVRAWEACLYSNKRPAGVGRASEYFVRFSEYVERADDLMSVVLMVERRDAVDNIESICQVLRPEKDMLHVGPYDLARDMKTQLGSVDHQRAIRRIEEAAARHDIKLAGHASTWRQACDMFDRGYRFLTYGEPYEAVLAKSSERFFRNDACPVAWYEIDEDLGFHLAYLDDAPPAANVAEPRPLGYRSIELPDIDNINYGEFLNLGFATPRVSDAQNKKLFLKFYTYPFGLDQRKSADRIVADYLFDQLPQAQTLRKFMSERVVIKKAWIADAQIVFSPQSPFPPLHVPTGQPQSQEEFDDKILFSSIYLRPVVPKDASNPDARAQYTARAVLSFHKDLLAAYSRTLTEVPGPKPQEEYCFVSENSASKELTVWRVPKSPLVFRNWRDNPMPQAAGMFLTGLLLVHRTIYKQTSASPVLVEALDLGSLEFSNHYQQRSGATLEIGSVVRTAPALCS